jgi:acyl carrier protein
MNELETEIKKLIVDTLALDDVEFEDIDSYAPLFNEGLGLDSIDALELGLAIRKKYNIKIDSEKDDVVKIFSSVNALSDFIKQSKG